MKWRKHLRDWPGSIYIIFCRRSRHLNDGTNFSFVISRTLQLSAKERKDGFNVNNTSFLRLLKLSGAEMTMFHVQKYHLVSHSTDFAKPMQTTHFKRFKVSVRTNKLAKSSLPIFSSMITVVATFTSTLKFGTSVFQTRLMRLMYWKTVERNDEGRESAQRQRINDPQKNKLKTLVPSMNSSHFLKTHSQFFWVCSLQYQQLALTLLSYK